VINDFADEATRAVYDGVDSKAARRIPKEIWPVAHRKLDMLNAAHDLRDLASPPGNRLERLSGRLKGFHSIRVNDQYRIVFRFDTGAARAVKIVDYH